MKKMKLSDDQVDALVSYLATLKSARSSSGDQ